jgi:hypothetical protein
MNCSSSFAEIQDISMNMKRLESTTYKISLPLTELFPNTGNFGNWRSTIVTWMYSIAEAFKLQQSVVSAAAYYLDKSVEQGIITSPAEYQLASLTSLHMAMKLYESKLFPWNELLKFGHGNFEDKDIIEMERSIMKGLDFHLHPPTANCFLQEFMKFLPRNILSKTRRKIEMESERLIQATVTHDEFAEFLPSVSAYAAMLLAMRGLSKDRISVSQIDRFILLVQAAAKLTSNSPGLLEVFQKLEPFMENYQEFVGTRQNPPAKEESKRHSTIVSEGLSQPYREMIM